MPQDGLKMARASQNIAQNFPKMASSFFFCSLLLQISHFCPLDGARHDAADYTPKRPKPSAGDIPPRVKGSQTPHRSRTELRTEVCNERDHSEGGGGEGAATPGRPSINKPVTEKNQSRSVSGGLWNPQDKSNATEPCKQERIRTRTRGNRNRRRHRCSHRRRSRSRGSTRCLRGGP